MGRKGFLSHLSFSCVNLGILLDVLGAVALSPTLPSASLLGFCTVHWRLTSTSLHPYIKNSNSEKSGGKKNSYVTIRLRVGWFPADLCLLGDCEFWLRLFMSLSLLCLHPH